MTIAVKTRYAFAIGLVLALAGAAPAWSQSQIGNGLSSAQDPYSSYYNGPAGAYRGFSGYGAVSPTGQ
jgi:hypothetical protein